VSLGGVAQGLGPAGVCGVPGCCDPWRLSSGAPAASWACPFCWLQSEGGSCSDCSCVKTACLKGSMLAASQKVLWAVSESSPSVASVMLRSSACCV
jgi:hypothetical protein